MDCLPLELVQWICESLDTAGIRKLRLVSKFFNYLATPYLLDEVKLVFHPQSFERLVAISRHPIIGPSIKTVYYEPGLLHQFRDQAEWTRRIELRARSKDLGEEHQTVHPNYDGIDRRYAMYKQLCQGQHNLKESRCGKNELEEAISGFPNLQRFCMNFDQNLEPLSEYHEDFFKGGLPPVCRGHRCSFLNNAHAWSASQLRAVFASAFLNDFRFSSFICTAFSWQLFKYPKKDLAEFATVISKAGYLSLRPKLQSYSHSATDAGKCRRFLRNGQVRDLVTQADCLHSLEFSFVCCRSCSFAIEFKDVVGDFTWPKLRYASFGYMETSEEDLVAFFRRHSATLRYCRLNSFCLTSGQWTSALPRIQSCITSTTSISLHGRLYSKNPFRRFDLNWPDRLYSGSVSEHQAAMRRALEIWFREGGDCPLTDAWQRNPDPKCAGYY